MILCQFSGKMGGTRCQNNLFSEGGHVVYIQLIKGTMNTTKSNDRNGCSKDHQHPVKIWVVWHINIKGIKSITKWQAIFLPCANTVTLVGGARDQNMPVRCRSYCIAN